MKKYLSITFLFLLIFQFTICNLQAQTGIYVASAKPVKDMKKVLASYPETFYLLVQFDRDTTLTLSDLDLLDSVYNYAFLNRDNPSAQSAHDYDIVYGPIANDRVGVQIGKYEAGDITLDQFLENLKYMKGITFQYYFGTERAIAKLTKL
jgi:hypothetical protein